MWVFWLILSLLILLNLFWVWIADLSLRRNRLSWKFRLFPPLFGTAMGVLLFLFFIGRGLDLPVRDLLPRPIVAAMYIWHLIILPGCLLLTPLTRMVAGVRGFWRHRRRKPSHAPRRDSPEGGIDRRVFLRTLGATVPPVALVGLTGFSMPQLSRFRVRRFEIPLYDLPPVLDGLTVVNLTDVHSGVFTTGPTMLQIAETTSRLNADLVLMPGDLINDDIADLPAAIEMIRAIDSRHGVFLCEGNHDLIPGPHAFRRECRAAGLNLLVNEQHTVTIHGVRVQILGLRWGSGDPFATRNENYSDEAIRGSLNELLRLRDPHAFPLLMAHHPHAFDFAAEAGLPLTVAGHTHGGQLMVNENLGFGPAMYRYWSGLYRLGESYAAISNGAGNWFPLRTAAPAEILHLTLRSVERRV